MSASGFIARHSIWSETEFDLASQLTDQVKSLGLTSIRISFPDQHGILRGKTLLPNALPTALRDGVSMTSSLLLKDTSHRTVFEVWSNDAGSGVGDLTGARDIIMVPIPRSFKVLPWSPRTGWLMGDVYRTDGSAIDLTGRQLLKTQSARLAERKMHLLTGLEVEFHVLKAPSQDSPAQLMQQGFQYLTEDRFDQLEDVHELIRSNACALGLPLRTMESEFGPSQCEVTFEPAAALEHADNMVLFRSMVKQVMRRANYHATFMCAPRIAGTMASGWHLHQSLQHTEKGNLFASSGAEALSEQGQHWLAGLLEHAIEGCIFASPTVNGYRRFKSYGMAPDRVQWSMDNKGAMLRVINQPRQASRVENRLGEPAANPYLYMAAQIVAGLDGLDQQRSLPSPTQTPYDSQAAILPKNLGTAIEALRRGRFFKSVFGEEFVAYYAHIKNAEWQRYLTTISEWEQDEYFNTF